MTLQSDYNRQPRYVRIYRWLRWRPYYRIYGCWRIGLWIICGMRDYEWGIVEDPEFRHKPTRWETITGAWSCYRGIAQCKMGHCYPAEEVFADLKERIEADEQ